MANSSSLRAKIDSLRTSVSKDSITPEMVGVVLDDVADLLDGVGEISSEASSVASDVKKSVTDMQKSLDTFSRYRAVSSITVDSSAFQDRVRIAYHQVSVAGVVSPVAFYSDIPAASIAFPGVMTPADKQWMKNLDEWFDDWDPATVKSNAMEAWQAVHGKQVDNAAVYEIIGKPDGICPLDELGRIPAGMLPQGTSTEGGGCQCRQYELMTGQEANALVLAILGGGIVDEPEPPGLTEDDFLSMQEAAGIVDRIFG